MAKRDKIPPGSLDGLTERQRRFVREYMVDGIATAAVVRAGYSKKSARAASYALMKNPRVIAALEKKREQREARTAVDAEWVLRRLAVLADSNILDFVKPGKGKKKNLVEVDLSELTREQAAALAGVTVDELKDGGQRVKIRLVDKLAALRDVGRHVSVKAFEDRIRVSGEGLTDYLDKLDAALGSTSQEPEAKQDGSGDVG